MAMCFILTVSSTGWAQEMGGKVGLRPQIGAMIRAWGSYNREVSSGEMLRSGPYGSLNLIQHISDHYAFEASVSFGWMPFRDRYKRNVRVNPAFVVPAFTFSNVLSFHRGRLGVYLPFGPGIYAWRFTEDGPTGEIAQFEGEDFKKMSAGVHAGLGVEWVLNSSLSFFIEARYHRIFCKDPFFFGEGFSEQSLLIWSGGVTFYLGRL